MLTIILGDLGSGKTLFMTIIAYKSKYKTIYSNYTLKIPKKKVKKFTTEILFDENLKNCLVLIDEVYTLVDARNFQTSLNKIMSYILFQSRKKNLDIYVTAQLLSTIEKRFRLMANYLVQCENIINGFLYTLTDLYSMTSKQIFLPLKIAKKFYRYYDTNELIRPEKDTNPFNIKEAEQIYEEIKKIIEKEYKNKKITKYLIKFVCMQNNISNAKLIDYIYLKLKVNENGVKRKRN